LKCPTAKRHGSGIRPIWNPTFCEERPNGEGPAHLITLEKSSEVSVRKENPALFSMVKIPVRWAVARKPGCVSGDTRG